MNITASTTAMELAAWVSQLLEAAGITATLSGGGAVSIYTENQYQSNDLDFVTVERRKRLSEVLSPHGFKLADDNRHFCHPATEFFLEFPAAPLEFGNRCLEASAIPKMETPWGPLRVITPTLCVMDRLASWWHWHDRQSWQQAVMVAAHQPVDYADLMIYAEEEGADPAEIRKLREQAQKFKTTPEA